MKIFLDANILFSAAKSDSHIQRLILLFVEQHELISSDYALEEARRNLVNKKQIWLKGLNQVSELLTIHNQIYLNINEDLADKDKPILGAALSSKSDYLLTSDKKDFGFLFGKKVKCLKVVTPSQIALELL